MAARLPAIVGAAPVETEVLAEPVLVTWLPEVAVGPVLEAVVMVLLALVEDDEVTVERVVADELALEVVEDDDDDLEVLLLELASSPLLTTLMLCQLPLRSV